MQFPLSSLFILIGVIQGFILGILFLSSPYFRSRSNRFLTYTFWSLSILGLNYSLLTLGFNNNWLILANDLMWQYLLLATLLFYFAYSLEHPLVRTNKKYWLYAPFLITAVVNILIDLDLDFGLYRAAILHYGTALDTYYAIEDIGTLAFAVITTAWSWKIIKSQAPRFPTYWFKEFWWWSTSIITLWIGLWLLDEIGRVDCVEYVFSAVTILFFWVTYRGVLQFKLAEEKYEVRSILKAHARPKYPQEKSTTNELTIPHNPYFHRLEQLMQEEHLYRDPDLNRDLVAKKLNISSGYLSQQLSTQSDLNFSEYVNHYRVEEVKRLLLDPTFKKYSLLAIGYEAGFNSKSTFYATFKKATGCSPSAFREQTHGKP